MVKFQSNSNFHTLPRRTMHTIQRDSSPTSPQYNLNHCNSVSLFSSPLQYTAVARHPQPSTPSPPFLHITYSHIHKPLFRFLPPFPSPTPASPSDLLDSLSFIPRVQWASANSCCSGLISRDGGRTSGRSGTWEPFSRYCCRSLSSIILMQ